MEFMRVSFSRRRHSSTYAVKLHLLEKRCRDKDCCWRDNCRRWQRWCQVCMASRRPGGRSIEVWNPRPRDLSVKLDSHLTGVAWYWPLVYNSSYFPERVRMKHCSPLIVRSIMDSRMRWALQIRETLPTLPSEPWTIHIALKVHIAQTLI